MRTSCTVTETGIQRYQSTETRSLHACYYVLLVHYAVQYLCWYSSCTAFIQLYSYYSSIHSSKAFMDLFETGNTRTIRFYGLIGGISTLMHSMCSFSNFLVRQHIFFIVVGGYQAPATQFHQVGLAGTIIIGIQDTEDIECPYALSEFTYLLS
jgi:hypothetical protein